MNKNFEVVFLEQAIEFLESLDSKTKEKIYYNIDKAKLGFDLKLFKKLTNEIWEFRTKYSGKQYILFAFWDKPKILVVSTHGIVKKANKVPKADIHKAEKIRKEYFK